MCTYGSALIVRPECAACPFRERKLSCVILRRKRGTSSIRQRNRLGRSYQTPSRWLPPLETILLLLWLWRGARGRERSKVLHCNFQTRQCPQISGEDLRVSAPPLHARALLDSPALCDLNEPLSPLHTHPNINVKSKPWHRV